MATSFQTPLSLGIFALCFGFVMAAWMTSQQCADMNTCSNAGASIIYTLPNDACDCIFYKVQPGITLEDSHSYCESLATTYETTCFLGLIMNSSTITSLENAGVITPSTNIFIDLNQQANGAEPDEDWQTVSWYGTNGPATDTPWAPGQPDDNAGANADQGVYTGGIGVCDEEPTAYAPRTTGVLCRCWLPSGDCVATNTRVCTTTTTTTTSTVTTPQMTTTTSTTPQTTTSTTTTTPTTTTTAPTTTTTPTTTSTTTTSTTSTTTKKPTTTSTTTTTTTTTKKPTTTSTTTTTKKPTTTSTTTTTKKPTTTSTTTTTTTTTTAPPPSACSIMGVDPDVRLSSKPRNYKVYGKVNDCAAKCAAETNFTCKGFVWKGPNSGCVLHGKLDLPVVMQNGSQWFLVDLDCKASQPCWWPVKSANIDPTSIKVAKKMVNVNNHNQCQALCLMGVLQPKCRAYALTDDPFYKDGYNCYLYPALNQNLISSAVSGKFVLYHNQCF